MALHAVGWLSGKLGVDITGQSKKKEDPKEDVFGALGDAVFGGGGDEQPGASTSSGGGRPKRVAADGTEVDEQGLPVGRDWYYYDKALGRFNVHDDAPAHIKEEHAAKVAAFEAEKAGKTAAVAPPPPPPPPPAATTSSAGNSTSNPSSPAGAFPPPPGAGGPVRSHQSPQYADSGFFSGGQQS